MSRCFPYPPPGYALSRASKDALIESIKFQNEKVKSKEQNKEKKREKKEKRKKKKDKAKQNLDKSRLVQSQFSEKKWADPKGKFLSKGSKGETEQQLEQSSLTEEHGKPECLRAPSTSSDSTENSNKRKRPSSPITHGHGKKIIRIRLPLKKQNQSDALANEQQLPSTSGRTNIPFQNEDDVIGIRNDREQVCSTSQPIETCAAKKTPNLPMIDAVLEPMQRAELQYSNLLDSLVPPQRQVALLDADELDWLFNSMNRGSCAEKRRISGNDSISCSSNSGLWPRAQYLQEVGVYALPFTVPF